MEKALNLEAAHVVMEHDFDEDTLAEFKTLRSIRLGLAEKQLSELDATISDMIKRGLLEESRRYSCQKDLKKELTDKIAILRARSKQDKTVFVDEIQFYLGLIPEESESQSRPNF